MEGMFSYTKAAVERAMQVQEVILGAMASPRASFWSRQKYMRCAGSLDRETRKVPGFSAVARTSNSPARSFRFHSQAPGRCRNGGERLNLRGEL